jgi:hypothetical protein
VIRGSDRRSVIGDQERRSIARLLIANIRLSVHRQPKPAPHTLITDH